MSLVVVRAAAGCGKTTELARRYLSFVASGIEVDRAIAITYTRRAAAELVERVTMALRASLPGPAADDARRALGEAWPLYEAVAPSDPEIALRALAALPSAPIGTTDRFVHALLTEHALYAAVPIPGAPAIPIDVPIRPVAGVAGHLERAARRILDPPGGGVDPDVELLTRYFGLDEILSWLEGPSVYDGLPVASTRVVMTQVAEHLARILQAHDVAAAWNVAEGAGVDGWEAALRAGTNASGQWAVPAVAAWMSAGRSQAPPFELVGWLHGLRRQGAARKQIAADLERTRLNLGPASLSLAEIVRTMRYPYDNLAHVELADRIQDARERLRARVTAEGLRTAAEAGELDHSSLTSAAIALCSDPPVRLQGWFRALLVDEVQDASPEQLQLYRAISELPGEPRIQTVMVGDARQSIYLFRGAEPAGFASLVRQVKAAGGEPVDLDTNFRSHPDLVEAQRALFQAIEGRMRADGYKPIDPLGGLLSHPQNAVLALDPELHDPPAPVWMVGPDDDQPIPWRDADLRALNAFVHRVGQAWTEAGHDGDTAVVLTPSWRMARDACASIRTWTGRSDAAFVDGGGAWLAGQVGQDIRMILRALLDPMDDIAWLGLWKHPMVGLSDGALARIRKGVGLRMGDPSAPTEAPEWCALLGRALHADHLAAPHSVPDIEAWDRAVAPLREARDRLGRDDLAGLLDRLAHHLEWRVILASGPAGDDGLAALEVALDYIRELESNAAAPEAVLARLEERDGGDLPRVHLDRPPNSISCTTVFQAKGLAWDHVCVYAPGRAARTWDPDPPRVAWVRMAGQDRRVVGLKFDPTGALSPFKDPVGRLGTRIARFRHEEECARLAYVAITRARRSVTFGLPTDLARCTGLQLTCATAWDRASFESTQIARVPWPAPPEHQHPPTGWAAQAEQPPERPSSSFARSWWVRQPSTFASHLDVETRRQEGERIASHVRLSGGLHVGQQDLPPPVERWPSLSPPEWGELAHGWLATWGFRTEPRREAAAAWLREAWGVEGPEIVAWLMAISAQLATTRGPMWDVVTDPAARLLFEHPFVGVAGERDDLVLSGRIDLLVQRGKTFTVIDFKAGSHSPTGWQDLVEQASLKTYGPQLDAYRAALLTSGRHVDRVGLWFVRTGTQVSW